MSSSIFNAVYLGLFLSFLRKLLEKFRPIDEDKLNLKPNDIVMRNGDTLVVLGFDIWDASEPHRVYIPVKVVSKRKTDINGGQLDHELSKIFRINAYFTGPKYQVEFKGAYRYGKDDFCSHKLRNCLVESVEYVPASLVRQMKRAIFNLI